MSFLIETFFDKNRIASHLDTLKVEKGEKEKLLEMINNLMELRFLHTILEKLEEKDKELFVMELQSGSQETTIEFLRRKIENLEDILREDAKVLEEEILSDVRDLKEEN